MFLMLSVGGAAVLLCGPVGIAKLVRSPKGIPELQSQVDNDLKAELARLLDESSPGNPRDAEIWDAIKRRGVLHFVGQVRLASALYFEGASLNPSGAVRARQVQESTNDAVLAALGCLIAACANRFGVRVGRSQALLAAHQFRMLWTDVDETLASVS